MAGSLFFMLNSGKGLEDKNLIHIFAPLKYMCGTSMPPLSVAFVVSAILYQITPLGQQRRGAERPRWPRTCSHSNAQSCSIFYLYNMVTHSLYERNTDNGFREYLNSSANNMFALDLSNCTLIECINKMCEIKSRSHPKIKQNYRMLVRKLEDIQKMFGCTIMPAMISSVFWNHFVPFLAD